MKLGQVVFLKIVSKKVNQNPNFLHGRQACTPTVQASATLQVQHGRGGKWPAEASKPCEGEGAGAGLWHARTQFIAKNVTQSTDSYYSLYANLQKSVCDTKVLFFL